jgi:crotonobetainyl-CoA:carnitine CoA-transferase CaiB-like acyl-CoA transferase
MQLQGIRVIDLTRILSGPFCSMFLADMGAEVIKIEEPGAGDPVRQQGEAVNGYSLYFATFNRNKRSMTLNLRSEEGKEVLRQLLRGADVVVNNYRPGVMDKMGFGRDALRALKPDIISCHVTGFGLDGPYRPTFSLPAVSPCAPATTMRLLPPTACLKRPMVRSPLPRLMTVSTSSCWPPWTWSI